MTTLVRATGMRGTAEVLREYGVSILPLMKPLGIAEEALEDEELRISLPALAELLELASEQLQCFDLGLQVAKKQDISILGPLAIAMENASTMGDALTVASSFLHSHSNGIQVSLHEGEEERVHLRMSLVLPSWQKNEQLLELCTADMYHFVNFLADNALPVIAIHLPHDPLLPPSYYQAYFKHPVYFGHAHAELILPSSVLSQHLLDATPQLHQLSLKYLEVAYQKTPSTIAHQVETILNKALSSTAGSRDVVASLLHLHPRTLQRRLAAEGTSFTTILTEVRKKQAIHWLKETEVPFSHVADILGFSDQAVLSRSCKKWFGLTPKQLRQSTQSS